MKGRKNHEHHRADGGRNDANEDLKSKPERYNESRVEDEAEERKHGGKAKKKRDERKRGGHVEKKHVGEVHGEHAHHHAGKRPRKSGGRANATSSPYSSARNGREPEGRKTDGSLC